MKTKLCVPEAMLQQHVVTLGKTGSGKSSAMRHIVEWLLEHNKRVCVIDPKGDWWGIKVSADGRGPGFPVVLFGDFKNLKAADVPINDRSGQHIAELVSSGNRPCVVGLGGWHQGSMTRFWIDFASTLFAKNAGELYLVGDEFHNFAPKGKVLSPQVGESIHWSNRLLSEGRGLGMVCIIASQRPQKVHNDTLTSCESLIGMRVVHKADRDAVKDWIDGNGDPEVGKTVLASLAGMPRGEAWVWSPEIGFGPERVKFPMFQTFDSFAPPQLQKKVTNAGWAEVNLEDVKQKLSKVIEEQKANDPAELRKQITDLQKQLKTRAPAAAPIAKVETKTVERHVLKDGQLARAEKLAERTNGMLERLAEVVVEIAAAVKLTRQPMPVNRPKPPPVALVPKVRAAPAHQATNGEDGGLTGPEQRILDAIAWMNSIGVDEPEQPAVAFLARYSYGSGSFNNPRGSLRAKALVEYIAGDKIKLTEDGRFLANTPDSAPTKEELHERILAKLDGPAQRILKPLLEAYPNSISNEELAAAANYASGSGSYNNPRGRLRSLGLIEYRQDGVVARDILFPE